MPHPALQGRIALVTGGGRGIGAATARLFAEHGAKVVIASRTESELRKVAASIGENALAVTTDVSDESAVRKLFAQIEQKFGLLDILINNAAIMGKGELSSLSVAEWDRTLAVNVRGSFLCAREAFAHFRRSGRGGSVVNVSSLAGIRGTEKFAGTAAYVTSKFAVVGMTEALAVEGRTDQIRVNCLAPGAVDTEMLRREVPHLQTQTRPEDIARTLLFLSDERQSGALSGSTIEVYSNL